MSSPAERYAASRRRQEEQREESQGRLASFRQLYDFPLDAFQIEACRALERGEGVLVAAPTGAGKTIVGEFAVHLALAEGRKCFYTTPIKALSNQKYSDLVRRYGPDTVGLLTGDNSINSEAPIVVMTTEVLRNMLYAGSPTLMGLGYVVMDEVHYLSDRFRGAVWEEVIIHLPESVRLVSLSATVSNAEEFGDWLQEVRGDTTVVVEEHRPVPLWQHVLVGTRMYDLFLETQGDDPARERRREVNPELVRLARDEGRFGERRGRGGRGPSGPRGRGGQHGGQHGGHGLVRTPSRPEVIARLDAEGLLPAITFIFSRAGCAAAVEQCMHAGLRLTTADERHEISRIVGERCADIPDEDRAVLGFYGWADALERGVAAHHAGMLPTFKEVVEELFVRGLVKAVFATETLALGINMPARSVVLERLVKYNGEAHVDVTAGEYTQLTGRAGRRGIDVEGHAVVLWTQGFDPRAVAGLASTRTYPLRSSFRPSYNMAVNLVGQMGRERARELLETSFAQFQADRAVVGLARQVQRNQEALDGYREAMTCHLGDFEEYARLRRELKDREALLSREGAALRRASAAQSLERLRPGDVIRVPTGRYAGIAVVLDPGLDGGREGPRPTVLTTERQVRRLALIDFPGPVEPLDRIRVPRNFNPRNPQQRRDLASTVRNAVPETAGRRPPKTRSLAADDTELARIRAAIRQHPCHGCDEREDHARWAERYWRLRRESQQLESKVASRTHTVARTFDRVCSVLESLHYLNGDRVTQDGRRLARIYSELDLLAAECLREGVWRDLGPAELAAAVSALVYEARRSEDAGPPRVPSGPVRVALEQTMRLWGQLDRLEDDNHLDFLHEPDLGFAWAAWRWASGADLDDVLRETDLPAGDFVRWVKQLVDLLDQIADAAAQVEGGGGSDAGDAATGGTPRSGIRRTAQRAIDGLRRGVVAYSSVG